jgi:nucleoside-diphosphate-sugar epimerase
MSRERTVLVTGATGSIGPAVLAQLLPRAGSVVVLMRPGREGVRARSDWLVRAISGHDPAAPVERLTFVPGDLSQDGAALAPEDHRRLNGEVTDVLHLAADTRFTLPLEQARAANLGTTLGVLRLVEGFGRLRALAVASTLYVAGTRTGEILESELADTEFVNTYERSKFEAERELRARMRDLPIAVFRIATLLGSAGTGEVRKPTAVHHALRLYFQGLVPMVPGDPSQVVELLDVEHAASAVARLLLDAFAPGTTFQVTAGPERGFTLEEMIGQAHRTFAELDPAWARRGIERPAIVSPATYALFERTVHQAADPSMTAVVRGMSTFLPQLTYPKRFDRRNTVAALPDWRPPATRDYFSRVLSFCLRTLWVADAGVSDRSVARR